MKSGEISDIFSLKDGVTEWRTLELIGCGNSSRVLREGLVHSRALLRVAWSSALWNMI